MGETGTLRVINIVDCFHPDAGYENNVLSKYFVKHGYEYTILTTDLPEESGFFENTELDKRDRAFTERTGVGVVRLHAFGRFSGRAKWNYRELINKIDELKPDVLFFCGNDTLIAMQYLYRIKKSKYAVVTDSHMLEMATKNKFAKLYRLLYKTFITPKIIKYQIPVIRLQNDSYVERCLGIPLTQAPWISFGSDTMLFHPDAEVKKSFRAEHGIFDDDFVVVYTGKMDEAKGGKLLAQVFKEKFQTKKNVVLVAVGSTSGEYGKEVEQIFAESENRIIRFPTQKYSDLARFYQAADLSVFARQCSLSFYDAQACGLPVLSEDNNINVDRCCHGNGWNFKAGDVQNFRAKIEAAVNMEQDEYQKTSARAYRFIIENYNYEDKAREYEAILMREYLKYKDKGV